jgi:hypothetical protein
MAKVWKYPSPAYGFSNSSAEFQESVQRGVKFVGALTSGEYSVCQQLLDEDEGIALRNTFSSNGKTPMWSLLGYYLENGTISNQDAEAKKIILQITERAINKPVVTDADFDLVTDLWAMNALASDKVDSKTCWLETLKHCIYERGMRITSKPDFAHQPVSKEMRELWDNWTERQPRKQAVVAAEPEDDKLCCICMEEKINAIWSHCAHQNSCFECSRDLKTCPVCRTEGYSKPMK